MNWEKGNRSSSYTVLGKFFLWGNEIFLNDTIFLLASICYLKRSSGMKPHKCLFFARGNSIYNDTTELSVADFNNILSAVFLVPALKPQEDSIQSMKPIMLTAERGVGSIRTR